MNNDLRTLYGWVRESRERLFEWAETLPPDVYTQEHPDFAFGSLRNIQAHTAECYLIWVGLRGLSLEQYARRLDASAVADVAAMRQIYAEVDEVLELAFERFETPDESMTVSVRQDELRVTGRWLVLHPVTHEFHHKGQMLMMGRLLGWPCPPDMDTGLGLPASDKAHA